MSTTLQKRLIFSSVFIAITVYTIFFSPAWLFFLVITAFALTGFYEYMDLALEKGGTVNRIYALAVAALIPIGVYASFSVASMVLATLLIFTYHFKKELQDNAFMNSALTVFGMLYVVLFLSQFLNIRKDFGAAYVFYTILAVKAGDAGAYFVGSQFGKTKLIEHVSPKKSVEGAVGGLLTTVVISVLAKSFLHDIPLIHLFVLGLLLSVVSQLGDLAESLLKRDVGIKDSGKIPGLGGILDVLDSLLLSVPTVYFYLTAIGI